MENTHTISYQETFTTIAEALKGELDIQQNEYRIFINNELAYGKIKGTVTNSAKLLMEIDLKCEKDSCIPIQTNATTPLHFIYCQQDSFSIKTSANTIKKSLDEFQTAISIRKNDPLVLSLVANSHVKTSIITIDNQMTSHTPGEVSIYNLFYDKLVHDSYEYIGSHNLKIKEQVSRLHQLSEEGLIRNLIIEGTVQLILALEIQNHYDDMDPENQPCNSLTKTELKKIQNLGFSIKQHPEEPYTIKELTMRTGISAAKLQDGFKHLFGRTVTDYIKNVRIELAEKMIKTTDFTISEIVYSIGFTSRSYFSKIFRERYNCSPRAYQVNQRYHSISA